MYLQKKQANLKVLKVNDENSRIQIQNSGSGYISERHGPADPDPYRTKMSWFRNTGIKKNTILVYYFSHLG
jgi:hypothetical protein